MVVIGPEYVGPALPELPEDESVDFWGIRARRTAHDGGAYWETCHQPLATVRTMADLAVYRWPTTDCFDYSGMRAAAAAHSTRVVQYGYTAPFYYY